MKIKIFFLTILLLISAGKVNAQSFSTGIYPPILQIEAEPPANVEAAIAIQNLSDQSVTYGISMVPFKDSGDLLGEPKYIQTDELYKKFFEKVEIQDDGKKVSEITLSPKQAKQLKLKATFPRGENLGDYYFSVIFLSKSEGDVVQSFLGAKGGIAVNVLFKVGPKLLATGGISEFSASKFVTHGPIPFKVVVSNTSLSYVSIKGNITIKNMFGQTIGQVELLPVNILSKSKRIIPSNQTDKLAIWPEKFLLGFYSAEVSVSLSDEGPIVRKKLTFFAFPVEGLIALGITGAIVFVIVRRVRSKSQVF